MVNDFGEDSGSLFCGLLVRWDAGPREGRFSCRRDRVEVTLEGGVESNDEGVDKESWVTQRCGVAVSRDDDGRDGQT